MKSALTVVLFRLFTIGVFVDGKEASNVSVMEGDSVTLKTGVTGVQTVDDIEWRFKGNRIDKFVDGLQLNSQTGDLKISNIRTKDSGLYKVKISSNSTTGSSEMEFNVNVVSADKVKSVSVMEGDSVPLRTDLTEIQRDDVIRWFGQHKSLVAEINRTAEIFNTYDAVLDGRFRDRLKLDHQTGSLTITNTTTTDSGYYEAEISSTRSRYTIHHTQSFSVTVRDVFGEVMSAMEGNRVTLNTGVTKKSVNDTFLWYFNDTLIAQINDHPEKSCLYYGKGEIFKDRLDVDYKTGSLIITTSRPEHTGRYQAEFIEGKPGKTETIITSSKCERTKINPKRSNLVIHKSFILIVGGSGLQSGSGVVAWIIAVGLLAAAVAVLVGVVVYQYCKISELKSQREENGVNLKKEKTDDSATELDDPLNREQQ